VTLHLYIILKVINQSIKKLDSTRFTSKPGWLVIRKSTKYCESRDELELKHEFKGIIGDGI